MTELRATDVLFPFQQAGVDYLSRGAATHDTHDTQWRYLADEQGLGKTVQAARAVHAIYEPRFEANAQECPRVVIVCPAIVRSMWHREMARWSGFPPLAVLSFQEVALGRRPFSREWACHRDIDVLIVDEAHRCSNPNAKQTLGVLKDLAKRALNVWLLSGTPMRNGPMDLWPILASGWPDQLRTRGLLREADFRWRYTYVRQGTYGLQSVGVRNHDDLQRLLRQVWLRRTTAEVLPDLPPIRWNHLSLDGGDEAGSVRRLDESGETAALWDAIYRGDLPGEGPVTATVRRLVGAAKVDASLEAIRQDLDGTDTKVFVTAYHRDVLDRLEDGLAEYGLVRVDGSTPREDRDLAIRQFQESPACRVYLGQIGANLEGVTLTAATVVHMVEPTWSPKDNEQSAKRVHRIGQTRPVVVHVHALAGTIDDAVVGVITQKLRAIQTVQAEPMPETTKEVRVI